MGLPLYFLSFFPIIFSPIRAASEQKPFSLVMKALGGDRPPS